jgi:hypothetical protein
MNNAISEKIGSTKSVFDDYHPFPDYAVKEPAIVIFEDGKKISQEE